MSVQEAGMDSKPKRIQLSRKKGWRKPEGVIVVSRPSKWGNPYKVADYEVDYSKDLGYDLLNWRKFATSDFRGLVEGRWGEDINYPFIHVVKEELRGHDLACWCPLDQPCHTDVLLDIANRDDA